MRGSLPFDGSDARAAMPVAAPGLAPAAAREKIGVTRALDPRRRGFGEGTMDAILAGLMVPDVQNHSLAALVGGARAAGFSARAIAFNRFSDVDEVARAVCEAQPRLFGLSMQASEVALAGATLIEVLRRRGFQGLVVAGGHFATLNAEVLLRELPRLDAVVRFGGQAALVSLLRGELARRPEAIPGLVFRDATGTARQGAAPELDLLPRRYAGDDAIGPSQPVHLGFPAADLVLSRGCEAHCGYCCVAGASDLAEASGARVERRDGAEIADTVAELFHRRGVRVFNFMDDNLLPLEPERALGWARELRDKLGARRVGRIALSMQLRADVCTRPVVDALAELGLVRAYVGIDGYSGRHLVALGREAPAAAGNEALANLAAAGVFTVCNALILGPTFSFENVRTEVEAIATVRHAPLHLLPIEVRAGSAYYERVRRRNLLEGGTLCQRYRFLDPRTALLGEALLGFPTRLEEYSVPVALYDLGYNLGIAARLLAPADVTESIDTYRRVTERWNADQVRLLRRAIVSAATGDQPTVRKFVAEESAPVRALDDELRTEIAVALARVERAAAARQGATVRAHVRGKLISSVLFSAALAACEQPLAKGDGGVRDAQSSIDARDAGRADAPSCPPGLTPADLDTHVDCAGNFSVEVNFDSQGVPGAVFLAADAGPVSQDALDCMQRLLAGYCYPSYANTTQTLVSTHFWIA
jgi:hypothetical protein